MALITESEDAETPTWWLAILLNVLGNLISAYGWILQKKTHNDEIATNENPIFTSNKSVFAEESKSVSKTLSYLKHYKWWCGYFTYGAGSGISAISYGFAPQSLLLPLESSVIVFNALLGAKFLEEHLCKKDWCGILLICFGLVICIFVGPKGEKDSIFTTQELEMLFRQMQFLILIIVYSLISFIDWILISWKQFTNDTFYMLSFDFIAAYFGSWNVLAVTCACKILGSSFHDVDIAKENFTHWLTYIIIIIWIGSVLILEYWRQKALAVYVSTYVMAIYRVFVTVGGVLFGALFFNDFQNSTTGEKVIFVFAVCIAIFGVFIVASKVDEHDVLEDRKTVIVNKNVYKNGQYNQANDVDTDIEIETINNTVTEAGDTENMTLV